MTRASIETKRFIQAMDCRVKPGNDGGWVSAGSPKHNQR
jgi:hypothetical protein